jgi:branched-chain amino acid transport system substrate-binding protein
MNLRATVAAAAVLAAGAAVAGCGGSDSGSASASGGGSDPIKVGIVLDQTGAVGVEARKAIQLAADEANASKVLGNRKISLDFQDSATNPKQAATITSKYVADKSIPVIMVGPGSPGALAAAPIAQRAKLPTDILESGSPGIVEAGDYIYRSSAPQDTYHNLMAEHFKNKGVKTVFQLYNNDIPTNKSLATSTWPALAKQYGLTITDSEAVASTATNFGTIASKIASQKPDAVMLHLSGAQYVSFISAVKRAGYAGIIGGGPGASSGTLKPLGKQADGMVYVAEYSASTSDPNGADFAKKYQAKEGSAPTLYAAGGYDAMNFIVASLKAANGDYSREGVHKGMQAAAAAGLPDAAMGAIKFENRDARIKGSLVEWENGKDQVITP